MTNTFPSHGTAVAASTAAAARRSAFRPILALLAGFGVVSLAMVAVLIILSVLGTSIDSAVWVRCSLVLGSAVVLYAIAVSASRGSRPAWLRLRIISVVVVVAVVVIVSIPGFLPGWVRIEQALCGVLVLPAAVLMNLPRMRAHFPRRA